MHSSPSHGTDLLPATVAWLGARPGRVRLLEQTLLPLETRFLELETVPQMVDAIRRLAVRGAPAIGVAAGYGALLGVQHMVRASTAELVQRLVEDCRTLVAARPTAVNLFWALERMESAGKAAHARGLDAAAALDTLFAEAEAIHREDADQCRRMGELGAPYVPDGVAVLTHCNAGALATGGMGTALAPIYVAHSQGKRVSVYADETRPLLQGARLTAWELSQAGVPVTLITDNMAARVMSEGRVGAVFVGSDRIAANGDVCNKIGTFGVAVLARHHNLPFYVVAPTSTFDPTVPTGAEIPIEEREPEEVTEGFGRRTAPTGVRVYNPAFDVTPAELVTAIITEAGVIERPDRTRVLELLSRARHRALAAG
ncbi:MAG: S-methyl-5-thioribose-1-phosphate isomerase [Planctomycetaceae bacterium]|nr:S-methyl-5-thioribose-1-phosphate isomerase [Planctomycetaceae bacterium]